MAGRGATSPRLPSFQSSLPPTKTPKSHDKDDHIYDRDRRIYVVNPG